MGMKLGLLNKCISSLNQNQPKMWVMTRSFKTGDEWAYSFLKAPAFKPVWLLQDP
jgi:hypothetical protein